MTAEQFRNAIVLAKADVTIDPIIHHLDDFLGYGLEGFEPITVTLEQVARCIIYQAGYMGGGWDEEEIENIKYFSRRKFIIK